MEIVQLELIKIAKTLGVAVDLLEDCATSNILLSKNGKEVLFGASATPLHEVSRQTFFTANNKQYCKRIFKQLNISHPKSIVFSDLEASYLEVEAFLEEGKCYVCKPLAGTEGRGVCMNLKKMADILVAWNSWREEYEQFMIEEQIQGGDLRIQAIGGKIVAACIREPATVIGDGLTTVKELVAQRHTVVNAQNPANKLELDLASFELLSSQNLSLTSIPALNKPVQLKYVANMNQGARSIDITDEIHPDYNNWITRLTTKLETSIFALDVLTIDYTKSPSSETAWALEINGEPYWYHHTFSERRTHNIGKMILEDVFGKED